MTQIIPPSKKSPPLRSPGRQGLNLGPGMGDDGWVSPPPVTLPDGTRVKLYKDGEGLKGAYDAIAAARQRVCVELYIFRSDPTGQAFADLLCKRAKEGIQVWLTYDSFGCCMSDQAMFDRMRNAGVRLEEFHPINPTRCTHAWRPFNRDHRKLIVVDDNVGWLGGMNIGGEYAGKWIVDNDPDARRPWRDCSIGLNGLAARHLLKAFAITWNYCVRGGRFGKTQFFRDLPSDGSDGIGIMAGAPSHRRSLITDHICKFVHDARQSLRLTAAYFAPTDDLVIELCEAARRGVKVQVMLPQHPDHSLMRFAAESFYETLLVAGAEVYERRAVMLHAKTMVIDDRIGLVGSTNMDFRSIEYNLEINCAIRSAAFAQQMAALFENDVAFADRIVLDEWRHRPIRDRFWQWAVRRARYLL